MKQTMEGIHCRLPDGLIQQIKDYAKQERRTFSQAIRILLEDAVKNKSNINKSL